jgi:hypothetical protein
MRSMAIDVGGVQRASPSAARFGLQDEWAILDLTAALIGARFDAWFDDNQVSLNSAFVQSLCGFPQHRVGQRQISPAAPWDQRTPTERIKLSEEVALQRRRAAGAVLQQPGQRRRPTGLRSTCST